MSRKLAACLSVLLLSLFAPQADADGNNAALNLALKAYQENDLGKAKLLFEKSLEFNPKDALAIYYLTQIEIKFYGFSTRTLRQLNAAYQADPEGEAGLEAYAQEKQLREVIRKEQTIALRTFAKDSGGLRLNVFTEKPRRVTIFSRCVRLAEPTRISEFEIGKQFKILLQVTVRANPEFTRLSSSKAVVEKDAHWDVSYSHPIIVVDGGMIFRYDGIMVGEPSVGYEWEENKRQYYFTEIEQKAELVDWDHKSESQYTFRPDANLGLGYCFNPDH